MGKTYRRLGKKTVKGCVMSGTNEISDASLKRVPIQRPEKIDVFLALACLVSSSSPDAQTKCGCVITTEDNRVIGTGYNGFPCGLDNDSLPNVRPDKYPWVNSQHSERNAVNNCILSPKQLGGGIAYVTGLCCFDCVCHMWNNGITKIYELIGFNDVKMVNEEMQKLKQELIERTGNRLSIQQIDVSTFLDCPALIKTFEQMGFIPK